MRALVVLCDPDTRRVAENALAARGHAVAHATDVRAVPGLCRREEYGFVLLDAPAGTTADVAAVCGALRTEAASAGPFLLVLLRPDEASAADLLAAGADDFDALPLDPGRFERRLMVAERRVARRAQARRFSEPLLDTSDVIVLQLDVEGRVVLANRAAEEITGYARTELAGRDWFELVMPRERNPGAWARFQGSSEQGMSRTFESPISTHRGEERILSWRDSDVVEDGRRVGTIWIGMDVTASRRALAALRESEARKTAAFDVALDCIVTMDHEGRILEFNPAAERTFGYTRGEALGRTVAELLVPPELRARHEAGLARYLATGEARVLGRRLEMPALCADGSEIPVELAITAVPMEGPPIFTAHLRDLTEQKRTQAALLESRKMESLGVLAGGIAHDFNNLLVGVLGNTSLALAALPEDSPARRFLERIERAGQRAADLVRQMLAFAGRARFVVRPLDLNGLTRETAELLEVTLPRQVALLLELAPELPPVEGDAAQLRQIVMNLVVNGAEAIGESSGSVSLRTGTAEAAARRFVFLEVRDTGAGMDEATRARIFEPFFSTKFAGRGLGLAAVRGIVRGHGGELEVTSEPGRGSCFRVLLPAGEGAPLPQTQHASDAGRRGVGSRAGRSRPGVRPRP